MLDWAIFALAVSYISLSVSRNMHCKIACFSSILVTAHRIFNLTWIMISSESICSQYSFPCLHNHEDSQISDGMSAKSTMHLVSLCA